MWGLEHTLLRRPGNVSKPSRSTTLPLQPPKTPIPLWVSRGAPLRVYGAALVSTLFVALGGCAARGGADEAQPDVGRAIQPIISGTASDGTQDAVVVLSQFEDGGRAGLCTATLVAPNLVLTARHCVSDVDSTVGCSTNGTPVVGGAVHTDRPPTELAVFVGKNGKTADLTVEKNAAARGKKLVVDKSKTICNRDLAFLVLDREIPNAKIAPIRLGAPEADEKLVAVGWGIDESGSLPATRRMREDLSLVGNGPMLYPNDERYGIGNAEFMLGESACAGDSGSPALAKTGAVVGVASRAGNGEKRDPDNMASTCMGENAHAIYGHLGAAKALVTRAFQEAGQEPWIEGELDPREKKKAAADAGAEGGPPPPTSIPKSYIVPPESEPAEDSAGGCSSGGEVPKNAVEQAAGAIALIGLIVGLRRRFGRRASHEAKPRERAHSIP
jgi:trypsin